MSDPGGRSVLRGRNLAMYVALCAVWGSTWLAIKIGLRDLPPLWFGGIRMALACVLLTPFALSSKTAPLTSRQRRWVAWTGVLQIGVAYACVFQGEEWIDSGLAALLFATFPAFVGLFAHFLLPEERLRPRTVAAALLGIAGVAVIEGPEALAALSGGATRLLVAGGALMVVSALAAAYSNVAFKKHLGGVAPLTTTWGQTAAGSLFILLLAALFERGASFHWTTSAVSSLLYLAICGTALPFVGLFWLLRRVPVAVIGTIPIVDTVLAILLGSVVLGESFSPRVLAGGAFILVSVLLAASKGAPPDQERKKNETAAIR
jgi:drug/metabolite transporter (DMT)-like permease